MGMGLKRPFPHQHSVFHMLFRACHRSGFSEVIGQLCSVFTWLVPVKAL
jgi:hypothetical protein